MNRYLMAGFMDKLAGYKIHKELMGILVKSLGRSVRKSSTELASGVNLREINNILSRIGTAPAKTKFPGYGKLIPDVSAERLRKFRRIKKPGWKKLYRQARKEWDKELRGIDTNSSLTGRQMAVRNSPAMRSAMDAHYPSDELDMIAQKVYKGRPI